MQLRRPGAAPPTMIATADRCRRPAPWRIRSRPRPACPAKAASMIGIERERRTHRRRRPCTSSSVDLVLAMRIERELAQLVARGLAVAAEQRHQRCARVRRDRQVRGAQLVVDQAGEVARGVGDSRGSRGVLRALAGLRNGASRRRSPASITMRQSCGGSSPARLDAAREVAAAGLDADRAAAAEQRDGHRLIDQARRLGRQVVAVEPHQRERIVGIVDGGRDQRVGALAHEAGVGAEDQDDRRARDRAARRRRRCRLSASARPCSCRADQVPATKNDASRGADVVGDHLGGAVLGVAQAARRGRSAAAGRECRRTRARRSSR